MRWQHGFELHLPRAALVAEAMHKNKLNVWFVIVCETSKLVDREKAICVVVHLEGVVKVHLEASGRTSCPCSRQLLSRLHAKIISITHGSSSNLIQYSEQW